MQPLTKLEAAEQLAKAVEKLGPNDLLEVFTELYPTKPYPDVSGSKAEQLAKELVARIRERIEPEEIVDLWKVVFADHRHVYWDEEDEVLRKRNILRDYAEQ